MKQIRIQYFISLLPCVFTNATLIYSLNRSATPAPSLSVLKVETGRECLTLNAVFTNSNRQIL